MATTTPNYGWAVPTSTDLVKDGATAIETLGDAIDASMNTALGTKKAGMVLLNTTSFSGVSSQSVNNVFSATYNNYQIILEIDSTSASGINMFLRLRVSGTDTTTNYRSGLATFLATNYTGGTTGTQNSTTSLVYGYRQGTTNNSFSIINLNAVNLAKPTHMNGFYNTDPTATDGNAGIVNGVQTDSTQFTSLTIFPASGTFSGKITIYGLAL